MAILSTHKVSHSGHVTPDNKVLGKYIGVWVDPVDHLDAVEKENVPVSEADGNPEPWSLNP